MDGLIDRNATGTKRSSADTLLRALAEAGIDYLFVNGGTDFPPIVEAYCRAEAEGWDVPKPIVVPHENTAVAMAHGVYLATGRMQAVMVHVNVGTANAINAVLDASREQIPILLMAGRSPYSEKGRHGTRTRYIHWAQEMYDQAGMIREAVKWDYELHLPEQMSDAVSRALELAQSGPKGPVYLTLPRDVLAGTDTRAEPGRVFAPVEPAPADPAKVAAVARMIAEAERPVIVTANAGRDVEAFHLLSDIAESHALPVASYHQRFTSIASDHPFEAGHDPMPWVKHADLVLVLDCDVPWVPAIAEPPEDAKIVHVGEDPIFSRYPMRSFRADVTLATTPALFLKALRAELGAASPAAQARRDGIVSRIATDKAKLATVVEDETVMTPELISRIIGEIVGPEAVIVNEYPLRVEHCARTRPATYFGLSPAGGLGWGFGAALGIKLAAPEQDVICTMGDGAYIFTNPTASHWVAQAQGLPVLMVIFNNALHGAVRNSTNAMYPDGYSAHSKGRMLADLSPSVDFESMAGAKGRGFRISDPAELRPVLQQALEVVRGGEQALVNILCDY